MIKIPVLADVSDILPDLNARRSKLGAEAQRLRTEILALARAPDEIEAPSSLSPDVAHLLGRPAPPSQPKRRERLAEMSRQIKVHEAAAEMLAREIEAEINKASAIIRERMQPEVDRRLRAVCLALAKAQEANLELEDLWGRLEDDGVRFVSSMPAVSTYFLGRPRDPEGSANSFLREALKVGLLTDKEMPSGMPR
ncbi:hypothetical protein ABLE91_24275 [Aquabacter sp. CN5-332]|uniref:hypothetical protein n=1 Tax=Aquabacter sp. CN5-332 TaxID=3156608 RepID=UPI0032B45B6E